MSRFDIPFRKSVKIRSLSRTMILVLQDDVGCIFILIIDDVECNLKIKFLFKHRIMPKCN